MTPIEPLEFLTTDLKPTIQEMEEWLHDNHEAVQDLLEDEIAAGESGDEQQIYDYKMHIGSLELAEQRLDQIKKERGVE